MKIQELPSGVYFTMYKTVDEFTTKEVLVEMKDMRSKSSDNLTMQDLDIDVYYRVALIGGLFVKYQGDVMRVGDDLAVAQGRMTREAREAIYKAVAGFEATTMHTKRVELSENVRTLLQKELDKSVPG